jgi:lipopolysaccharide transport system ATP-binding protein
MSDTVIQINHLSKYYRLGVIGIERLVDDVNRWWARLRRKPYPLSKIGRQTTAKSTNLNGSASNGIWALKNVSFEVKRGEVLGIIGRNGAGKSTLLKILSRVTTPTSGEAFIKGRIASLLEVGTGFHPELTGRENISLNGAILGMTKAEIRKKFDEIVEFAGVEQFIDTPVKRYSSGMYVRLAFAVAAHLESEILIVDEVLAVGDAHFQKKCLGKMGNVAKQLGRTILFVSHNMQAVTSLCSRGIVIENGLIATDNRADEAVKSYISLISPEGLKDRERVWGDLHSAPGNDRIRIRRIAIVACGDDRFSPIEMSTPFQIEVDYWNFVPGTKLLLNLYFDAPDGTVLLESFTTDEPNWFGRDHPKGLFRSICLVPGNLLNAGNFKIRINFLDERIVKLFDFEEAPSFTIVDTNSRKITSYTPLGGYFHVQLNWQTTRLEES